MFVPLGQIFLTYKTHRGGTKTFMTQTFGKHFYSERKWGGGGDKHI